MSLRTCRHCGLASDDLALFVTSNESRYGRANRCWRCHILIGKYGISRLEYEELLEQQSGVCAICGEGLGDEPKWANLAVDHDHATGTIRGILCHRCNTGLGGFRDQPALLRAAALYLEGELPSNT